MAHEKYSSRNLGELALLISDQITAMLAYWDKDLKCRFANSAYVDWFGKTKEEMINKMSIDELLGPLYEKNLPYIKGALAGTKQLFEREIPIPGSSGVRHSLATYIPDIKNGEVLGFFVHVADVSYLKELEKEIALAKRETLQKIIEMEENEKRHLVEILRESVNQRLVACKLLIESERKKGANVGLYEDVGSSISEIIRELSLLCQDLIPTEIEVLGLLEAAEMYMAKFSKRNQIQIECVFEDKRIEHTMLKDKYSIFRILQNFMTIAADNADIKNIAVTVRYTEPHVKIRFVTDAKLLLKKSLKEYHAIACRIDYYSGKITEYVAGSKSVFDIEFSIPEIK